MRDEPVAVTFANREEPISIIPPVQTPTADTPSSPRSGHNYLRDTAARLRDRIHDGKEDEKVPASPSIQDRFIGAVLAQVIPSEDVSTESKTGQPTYGHPQRPAFSLPQMSNNFRRFNARIGVAFVFQYRMIRLFSWKYPTQTLTFLAVYSFICLNPHLLPVLPLGICIFYLMIPAYLARHPPPPQNVSSDVLLYSIEGPALAPPKSIKPAPEMSKDFFRNMRDLQNSMDDFSKMHDLIIKLVAPYTNFSDEKLSSFIFLALVVSASFLVLFSHLIPWRAVFLIGGWVVIGSSHPLVQHHLNTSPQATNAAKTGHHANTQLENLIAADIVLDTPPEQREVEVFELQYRPSESTTDIWEGWLFSASPFEPLSPARIAGERPRGTRFFEDVQAPRGWTWSDKKWTLDLLSKEWVDERLITDVEVETQGERWVYDLGYDEVSSSAAKGSSRVSLSWEESNGLRPKGEWRRRRWIRLVQRTKVKGKSEG